MLGVETSPNSRMSNIDWTKEDPEAFPRDKDNLIYYIQTSCLSHHWLRLNQCLWYNNISNIHYIYTSAVFMPTSEGSLNFCKPPTDAPCACFDTQRFPMSLARHTLLTYRLGLTSNVSQQGRPLLVRLLTGQSMNRNPLSLPQRTLLQKRVRSIATSMIPAP